MIKFMSAQTAKEKSIENKEKEFVRLHNHIARGITSAVESGDCSIEVEFNTQLRAHEKRIKAELEEAGYEVTYTYPNCWQNESEKRMKISWI